MNPNSISVLDDPWIFEMHVSLKPTFVNINFIDENFHINNFIHDGS